MTPFSLVVPCSTSNLGSGFDALGIALGGPELRLQVTPGGSGLRIERLTGEGEATLPRDGQNRLLVAAARACERRGTPFAALAAGLEVHSTIPLKRGLGSSAAAAVAGALLAEALCDETLGGTAQPGLASTERVQATALSLEGHPDNVVPCLYGGARVAVLDAAGGVVSCPLQLGVPLRAALFIPEQELSTEEARAVLPREVPLRDAVHNLGRSALLVAALGAGRLDLIAEAMDDRLHQPARGRLLPWLPGMLRAAVEAGAAGAALSGAGTTVFALCAARSADAIRGALERHAASVGLRGRALAVDLGVPGARVDR